MIALTIIIVPSLKFTLPAFQCPIIPTVVVGIIVAREVDAAIAGGTLNKAVKTPT